MFSIEMLAPILKSQADGILKGKSPDGLRIAVDTTGCHQLRHDNTEPLKRCIVLVPCDPFDISDVEINGALISVTYKNTEIIITDANV